jgi:hypothetical protein
MTRTVKQITLTSPTAPPMIGPRDKYLLLGATTDMVGARSIIATVCEVPPDDVSFECDPVGKLANELGCWAEVLIEDNHSRDCPETHVLPCDSESVELHGLQLIRKSSLSEAMKEKEMKYHMSELA